VAKSKMTNKRQDLTRMNHDKNDDADVEPIRVIVVIVGHPR